MVILNTVTLSGAINYHWYLFAYTSVVNGKEEIATVIIPYQSRTLFNTEKLEIVGEEIRSKRGIGSDGFEIISVSYLGDATKEKFGVTL